MILPKLLTRVLSRHSLQDLRSTGMFIDELGDVVDVVVDDYVHALVRGVVGCDVLGSEYFGHCEGGNPWVYDGKI